MTTQYFVQVELKQGDNDVALHEAMKSAGFLRAVFERNADRRVICLALLPATYAHVSSSSIEVVAKEAERIAKTIEDKALVLVTRGPFYGRLREIKPERFYELTGHHPPE